MTKYISLLRLNFRQNFKIFMSFNIISLISFILTFILCKLRINYAIINQISNSIELASSINWNLSIFLIFETILFTLYIFTVVHLRFSDYFGTLYTVMQLPIKRGVHLFSIVLEGIIFVLIQYILFYFLLKANYIYLLASLSKIENSHLYMMYEYFRGVESVSAFGELYPLWSISIKNILYRLLISWPAISSYCIFAYMLVYKLGTKIVFAIVTTILLLIIFISNVSFISNIIDMSIRVLFETFFYKISFRNILNSIFVFLSVVFVNTYIIKKELDF